ncbi:MAG TPA: transglutaminase domain-containing protein [Xanthomonadaceae bacterium]|nr:transglutaminase domain-containing protein [Xanthomonadaceae bacterium]
MVDAGRFAEAGRAIDARLADPGIDAGTADALRFERERMRRILLDFTLSASEVKARVAERIPDLTDAEFAAWDAAGLFERMTIDGRTLYFNRSPSNLFRLSDAALARRAHQVPLPEGPMESANAHHRAIVEAAAATGSTSVLPRRVRVTQSLTVDADAVPAGETVRAWIPYPRAIDGLQEDIRLLDSEPARHAIAPESTLQRTVYLERPAVAGEPTEFAITYELTRYARHHAIDPDRVVPATLTAELAPHVAEQPPHVVFTDDLRAFSRRVVGDETNPYRIAQKLFAAVDDIPWAGAREYSTISNISDYALHAGHADCGQQTLLLITLLRLNGIPARWQSGMVFSDGDYDNLHDWGLVYLAPYGWVPMDVTTGRFEQAPGLEWFYLGGVDAYRIAFNDEWGTPFEPAKAHFRSETVDSQRGEAEWDGGNLYFDQWDYGFDAKVLATPTDLPEGA